MVGSALNSAPELQPGLPSPGPETTSLLQLCWGLVEGVSTVEELGWGPYIILCANLLPWWFQSAPRLYIRGTEESKRV